MTCLRNDPSLTEGLRQRAEQLAGERVVQFTEDLRNLPPAKIQALFHELQLQKIELELQNEELCLFKAIIEMSREAVAISDRQGRLIYINPAHERLFGFALAEARQRNYREYYPPESIEILDTVVAPALRRGESWQGELEAFDAGGDRFCLWEQADSLHDEQGRYLFGFGLMHNATEQRQAQQALRESEEKYRLLVENQRDLLVKTDADERILFANPVCCTLLAKTNEELREVQLSALFHPDDQPGVNKALASLFKPPHECQYEGRIGTPQGWRWINWVVKAVLGLQGNVTGMIGSGWDITERIQAEAKVSEQLAELRRWYQITLGREDRVMELKQEVNRLLVESGRPPRYPSAEELEHA